MRMPMITGPRVNPRSEIAVNVPIAGPTEEPTRSRIYANKAGTRKAFPIPQIAATRINIGSVLEKVRMTIERM